MLTDCPAEMTEGFQTRSKCLVAESRRYGAQVRLFEYTVFTSTADRENSGGRFLRRVS